MEKTLDGTGLEVIDCVSAPFDEPGIKPRDVAAQTEGLRRLAHAFVEDPDSILQVLVDTAVDLCGAESAGISVVEPDAPDHEHFKWVATSGKYSAFLGARLPRYPSACSVTLGRGRPQRFRVTKVFFDILGVVAPEVTDGILLPWRVGETEGTIFVMAHDNANAFYAGDVRMMQLLADFAAMAVRQQTQSKALLEQSALKAAAEMASEMAHEINNPLQILTNLVYLGHSGLGAEDVRALATEIDIHLERLSGIVQKLVSLGVKAHENTEEIKRGVA